ncbi:hypothetical protein SELMODRAFT_413811 [Selaginella moellendorffii]|uniref:Uncharacterized protein n=1 Tax=Selaginella moellendorffii TaxID=88036 RepID=D8RQA5_SELML|nr:uncharacterized protein LOC9638250 [Selaginella moellendorffii]XP_002993607.1 uncharacterized protein LOC9663448 [Selaginella moellendorffii]EFJ05299.1 hypothetical protein SELMODRAFT_431675 [Selaginella moellendorffii]EFJ25821.1 hypothetical protein SELMODRAFT_413811 [Selaginella moellendorffii]|eukprot:XP_002973447.1 uncharacterized protein LOC9638250 [Selaginella moellendorffii]
MASAKAPFGTMHNQPPPRNRKHADPAPWDRDPSGGSSRAPLSSRSSGSGNAAAPASKSVSRPAKDHQVEQPSSGRRIANQGANSSGKPAAPPVVSQRSAAAKVAGSTKTAPFGTAHNAPAQAHKNVGASKAPWERDDSQRFQKIAFGNLKSFGAFIRT